MPHAELHKRKKSKNIALMLVLLALIVLFFTLSLLKMGGGA